jgi:hypothetical protein
MKNDDVQRIIAAAGVTVFVIFIVAGFGYLASATDPKPRMSLKERLQQSYDQGAIDHYLGKNEVKPLLFDTEGKAVSFKVEKKDGPQERTTP